MDPNELTTEDWYTVLEGATAASGLIMTADLSGPIGLTKEASAAVDVLREGQWKTPFIAAFRSQVLAGTKEQQEAFKQIAEARQEALKGQKPSHEQAVQMGLDAITGAVALVQSKAGDDAAAEYRQLIWEVAQKTAAAGKEGGFLGFGGKPVSDAEQASLDRIRGVLGL